MQFTILCAVLYSTVLYVEYVPWAEVFVQYAC